MQVLVRDTPDDIADLAATTIAGWLAEHNGAVSLGLAGGSTPRATYRRLRDERVDWERVHGWLADERWVPADHPDSNAGMVRETLFEHVPARLHEVPFELSDPHAAAVAYEATLERVLTSGPAGPTPDVVLLGMGDDGHTASLFPGTAALTETSRLVIANWVAAQNGWRITATLPLLSVAKRIGFLVTGAAKAEKVAAILDRGEDYPAGSVATAASDVTWFLDEAAAWLLTNGGDQSG